RFDLRQQQETVGHERIVEAVEQRLLRLALEVDDDVAADDEVLAGRIRVAHQVERRELHHAPHLGPHTLTLRSLEPAVAQLVRDFAEREGRILAAARDLERTRVNVGAEHAYARGVEPGLRPVLEHQNRQRVRLFPARRTGTPDTDGSALQRERGEREARRRLPHFGIAEQLADVDRDRIEQARVLAGIALEQLRVFAVAVHAARAHAHRDAPAQAL